MLLSTWPYGPLHKLRTWAFPWGIYQPLGFFKTCTGHRTCPNRRWRWRREYAVIEIECVAKLSALAVQISMLHAMLCAVCCHELSSYRYADVMTHFECFGEFASFRLKPYITVNYFSKGQKAKRSLILSRDFPKGHLFCSTTQYSRYFQGHLFCCLRYMY